MGLLHAMLQLTKHKMLAQQYRGSSVRAWDLEVQGIRASGVVAEAGLHAWSQSFYL